MNTSFEKIRYNNGVYFGQFDSREQVKQGIGFFLWESGDLFMGQFEDDHINGRGLFLEIEGGMQVTGHFKANKLNGPSYINL